MAPRTNVTPPTSSSQRRTAKYPCWTLTDHRGVLVAKGLPLLAPCSAGGRRTDGVPAAASMSIVPKRQLDPSIVDPHAFRPPALQGVAGPMAFPRQLRCRLSQSGSWIHRSWIHTPFDPPHCGGLVTASTHPTHSPLIRHEPEYSRVRCLGLPPLAEPFDTTAPPMYHLLGSSWKFLKIQSTNRGS